MTKKLLFRRILCSFIIVFTLIIIVAAVLEHREHTFYLKALFPLTAGILGLVSTFYTSIDKPVSDRLTRDFNEITLNYFHDDRRAKKLFYKGYRAWYTDHHETAYYYLKKAQKAAASPEAEARILFLIGRTALEEKKYGRAVEYFHKALELDPSYDMVWSNLATIYFDENQSDKAAKCCENAIFYNPRNTFAYNKLGNYYLNTGKHEKSLSCFEKATKEMPDHPVIRMNYAKALSVLGKEREMLEQYQIAVGAGYSDPDQKILAQLKQDAVLAGQLQQEQPCESI